LLALNLFALRAASEADDPSKGLWDSADEAASAPSKGSGNSRKSERSVDRGSKKDTRREGAKPKHSRAKTGTTAEAQVAESKAKKQPLRKRVPASKKGNTAPSTQFDVKTKRSKRAVQNDPVHQLEQRSQIGARDQVRVPTAEPTEDVNWGHLYEIEEPKPASTEPSAKSESEVAN
jgi:hypothetical protein